MIPDRPAIDLFVRTGFRDSHSELPAWISSQLGCSLTRHKLGADFAPVALKILRGSAPFVAFLDDRIELSGEAFLGLMDLLLSAPECSGVTLGAPALTAIFGDFPEPGSSDPRVVRLRALPPWLSILRRDSIPAARLRQWRTVEFLLLDIAVQSPQALFVRIGDEHSMGLEGRPWACDLLDAGAQALAADFSSFRASYPQAQDIVPPQFAIEIVGEPTEPPKLLARANRGGFPKFSVICPVFKPNFLVEMLQSVKRQTYHNWDLNLLVDGPAQAAESKIADILSEHAKDPRIHYGFQVNRGTGPTRDSLAAAATGDFILSIDDDDKLTSDAMETFASAILHNPGVPFFRGGAVLTGTYSRELRPHPRRVISGISNDVFEVTQPFVIAREALQAIGGFEWDAGLRNAGEDTILFQKLDRLRLETRIVDRVLYHRRLSTANLTLEFNREECANHAQTLSRLTHPPEWRLLDCQEELADDFQRSSSAYQGPDKRIVFTSTRFFQYRTFGPVSETTIDLELTSACNAVCTFCPREAMPDKTQFLSVNRVEKLADQLQKLKRKPQVVFCGIGESTLHPQLETIAGMVASAGASLSMTTNGARMTPELFHRLVRRGMYGFNFSLNAASPAIYQRVMKLKGLDKVSSTIDRLIEIKRTQYPWVALHVSFVVCDQNQHETHHFVEQWRNRGVTQVWLHPLNNRAGLVAESARAVSLEQYARDYEGDEIVVVDVLRDRGAPDGLCKVARSFNFISADGEVRLCAMDYRRETRYGDILTEDLQSAHYKKLQAFLAGETGAICDGCDFNPHPKAAGPPALLQIASANKAAARGAQMTR
jgi:MoaA/NifB/PqqE/SkfB family radical SAM enzyme/glycosyltransferase involved in cell wall biosynthesis